MEVVWHIYIYIYIHTHVAIFNLKKVGRNRTLKDDLQPIERKKKKKKKKKKSSL